MKIIIVGCGKVGYTLVEQLINENHEIVVIDENADHLKSVQDDFDVMGVVGNGINYTTLINAGISDADLLIAVTGSDEQNLLCCVISKKTGNCHTIARVRNPIYFSEIDFFKNTFGISMIINPEATAADEISRILQFPSAIKIDTFAKGHVELLHFKVTKDSMLNNYIINNIRTNLRCNLLVCIINRNGHVIIPKGNFVLRENDLVGIVAERKEAIKFFKKCGIMTKGVQNAMLAGGGKISYYLACHLAQAGIHTTIIERNPVRCHELSELLPKAEIICGDATDQKILLQEGLTATEGFASLTDLDEENILLSLYSNQVSNAKTITKINRINFASVINGLSLGSIVNPQLMTANYILKYVRSMNNAMDSNVENLYKLEQGKAEALEFYIHESSAITNIPLQDLKLKNNILICCIYRNNSIIIPSGQDTIQVHDSVVIILSNYRISDIVEILED